MRRVAKRTHGATFLSLDSFIDIVMNVIGCLFFVLVYVSLLSTEIKSKVTTPIMAGGATHGMVFECRNQTVFCPDIDVLREELVEEVLKKTNGNSQIYALIDINETRVANAYYSARLSISGESSISLHLKPKSDAHGETAGQIKHPLSAFQLKLADMNPKKQHIFFVVRPDSFEVFHAARKEVLKQNFGVGWDPMEQNRNVVFGGDGVSVISVNDKAF